MVDIKGNLSFLLLKEENVTFEFMLSSLLLFCLIAYANFLEHA